MDALDLPHLDKGPRDGPVVILLHGFPLDHTMWAPQVPALEAAGARVLVPDLRGLGKAPTTRGAGRMNDYAADVLRMAERAGIQRFALAGFSMGGYVAFEVARQLMEATSIGRDEHGRVEVARLAPEKLTGLALIDTKPGPDSKDARAARYQTIDSVRAGGARVVGEKMAPLMLTRAAPEPLQDSVRALMGAQRVEGVVGALQAIAERVDQTALLPTLKVPTVVIVGENDTITPVAEAEAMVKALPDAKLVVIPGAAHLTTLEKPDDVNAALVEWVARLRK